MVFRVAGAQLNLHVGDIAGNEQRIAGVIERASADGVDILVLPELALTGYPPEDLVNRSDFVEANRDAMHRLAERTGETAVVVGFVDRTEPGHSEAVDSGSREVANAAAVLHRGGIVGIYHKILLPNYGVFDEDRNFSPGSEPGLTWVIDELRVGVSICEDIWLPDGPPAAQAAAGAQVLININASPFHRGKATDREEMLSERARAAGVPLVYVNLVGGQDELVFDGASVVFDGGGNLIHRSPQFEEDYFVVDLELGELGDGFAALTPPSPAEAADGPPTSGGTKKNPPPSPAEAADGPPTSGGTKITPLLHPVEEVYRALTTALGDYVRKNGFEGVVIALSGGIDSALTAVLAADAIGPDAVWGIAMPSRFSSQHSLDDARDLAGNLGIRFDVVPIDGVYQAFLDGLDDLFIGTGFGVAEENLQARARGMLVMAISNKFGPMVVSTGNKSEMATGYATLYGDMAGGYAILKDVFKTLIYDLARWRNRDGEVIPQNTIDKPPSAELRPDQFDSDSLPSYEILDGILERYVERDLSPAQIVADGYDPDIVRRVARMVDRAEYKRRQAAPGVKITVKAFGKDRRLPITNAFTPGGT